jgi:hypothetical protein
MQEWLLNEKIKWDDIEFINGCGIDYTLFDPALLSANDSGWCDAGTGYRIPTETMRVIFNVASKRDVHILKLKFGDAIGPSTFIFEELPD